MIRNILNISVIDMLRMIRKLPERFSLGSFLLGSALAVDLPSDSEVNQQTTGYAGVISIALASRKIPPMLS